MPPTSRTSPEHGVGSEATTAGASVERIGLVTVAIAFVAAQLFDFATAPGLSSTEPKGYFAEVNPLLAQIGDPVTRQYVGFALKVAVVIFVIGVARLQRRRAFGAAILLVGTAAGLFGAWSNMNPWR